MKPSLSPILATARERASNASIAPAPLMILVAALIGIGLLARCSPFLDPEGRLYWQYMTEDGYLMQTIARNMAIGLGMTTSEGTIATNGVQPLATILFTGLHAVAGGSKLGGVVLVSIASIIASLLAGYFLYRIAALVMGGLPHGRQLAALAAGLWFCAPLIVPISMNGLETSLYWAVLLATSSYYLSVTREEQTAFGWRQRLLLGFLLGLTFLARNDAVFFIAIVLLVHLAVGGSAGGGYARRLTDCIVAGLVSILVAAPWLIYNYRLFGSIVPISGTAQSYSTALGSNLALIPAKAFEAAALYLPLPARFERMLPTMLMSGVLLVVAFWTCWVALAKRDVTARRFLLIGFGLLICLGGYYGVAFGAPHFLARYLSILSPFLWIATFIALFHFVLVLLPAQKVKYAVFATVVALASIGAATAGLTYVRGYSEGTAHMHKQVVEWVAANVPESSWVGAPQTGTLGYFHDRTLNLDGKVNPQALRVLLADGHILNYAVDSKIDYIADWVGMAEWVALRHLSPRFAQQFVVVVKDDQRNLAALKRIQSATE